MTTYATPETETEREDVRSDPDAEPLTPEEIQSVVSAVLADAAQYTDGDLSPKRAKATSYYKGEKFGNEEEGRSQVVLTEVRDSVLGVLPSLLRVVFGPERVVEFVPKRPETVQLARQITDYIQHIFAEEQGGFLKTLAVLKDGLVRQVGVFKWWWEEEARKAVRMEGLTLDQVLMLEMDPDVEITDTKLRPKRKPTALQRVKEALQLAAPEPDLFDVECTKVDQEGHPCIEAVPPEEFIFSREARGMDGALCVAHRTNKTRSELIAMGIDPEEIDEHGGLDPAIRMNPEEIARREMVVHDPEAGEANEKIAYCEAWIPLDVDGDGVAEMRKVCTIGPMYHVVSEEPADDIPFAIFCPDPEPHTMLGQSWADRTMDLQLIKSSIARAINDSAALAAFPRTWYVRGRVNIADILNTAIGQPIGMDAPGMAGEFGHRFMGADLLPLLGYYDDVSERRTGQNKGAVGLDADALQSTSAKGVNAAVTASQAQTEMLARLFAEMCLKPLFRGLYKLVVQHQPRAKMVRLRGEWIEMDPRTWDADCDVTVNVALGSTLVEGRQQALAMILSKQEQVLSALGVNQPLVTPAQYANTLRRLTELLGFKDVDAFFSAVPEDWQPPPQEPQESPEQVIAQAQLQIEQMKTERELAIKEAELRLKQEQNQTTNALDVARLAVEETLRRMQINAQYDASISAQQLQADAKSQEMYLEAQKLGHEQAAREHEAALDEQRQAHEQDMAARQAAEPTNTSEA